jgi:hypothetical protein
MKDEYLYIINKKGRLLAFFRLRKFYLGDLAQKQIYTKVETILASIFIISPIGAN